MNWEADYKPKRRSIEPAKGRPTWSKLLKTHGQSFLNWQETNNTFENHFTFLGDSLHQYLIYRFNLDPDHPPEFVKCLPKVITSCDSNIYHKVAVADAYAYVHLLERYRRFWCVLKLLTENAILPLREHHIKCIDVGSGPAPVSYSLADFYKDLNLFANDTRNEILKKVPNPVLLPLESSLQMQNFMHFYSEFSLRKGPFHAMYEEFGKLDFELLRTQERISANLEGRKYDAYKWRSSHRFQLCVLSYFLTKSEILENYKNNLSSLIDSITLGGLLVFLGSTAEKYRKVSESINEVVVKRGFELRLNKDVKLGDEEFAVAPIKKLYLAVWSYLEKLNIDTSKTKRQLSDFNYNCIYDPKADYVSPKFNVCVWRRDKETEELV